MVAGILFAGAVPAPAQVTQMLHSTPPSPARDNYSGVVGCQFQVGTTNVIVLHLGVFDLNNDGLAASHKAALFSSSLAVLGQVVVPAGTSAYLTNGFRWVPLDPPLLLISNTSYLVGGVVSNLDGDTWQDSLPRLGTHFLSVRLRPLPATRCMDRAMPTGSPSFGRRLPCPTTSPTIRMVM